MGNQDRNNRNVAENIKDTAGAAFHSIHKGLEATENAAMNAVDKTAEAIDNVTENDNKRNGR
ncbi:DNA-binding ferritin-like protein [Bacillus mesophilus]|uniref:Uncharacterized protein n=1 Tax=Bacillus mesophilus TaxID=1808955 RepID=A0A6M0Q441_9BACI|nr:hypothetical protein [Bacillus mesophilus]MBM7660259.1 DNA-binding ferritin-like protein [Bacillus mesophilus]NEY70974.1 hypothetical protein [Bacillus mesophilus]